MSTHFRGARVFAIPGAFVLVVACTSSRGAVAPAPPAVSHDIAALRTMIDVPNTPSAATYCVTHPAPPSSAPGPDDWGLEGAASFDGWNSVPLKTALQSSPKSDEAFTESPCFPAPVNDAIRMGASFDAHVPGSIGRSPLLSGHVAVVGTTLLFQLHTT